MNGWRSAWIVGLVVPSLMLGCASGADSRSEEARSGTEQLRIAELEEENTPLEEQVNSLRARLEHILQVVGASVSIDLVVPRVDASVLDVHRALKLVVLDKGKKDGVEPGFDFHVYRGSTFKGMVKIQDVRETTSTGLIFSEKNPIEAGDSAGTVL